MDKVRRVDLRTYGISVVSVLVATVLTISVEPLFQGKAPLSFFTAAVILSAMFGLGPGLLATGLSLVCAVLFFNTIFMLVLSHSSLGAFVVIGIGISVVMGRLQRANAALRRSREALQEANRQLSERERLLSRSNEELQRFAYALAHDLTTPVRSIHALTDLLIQRNADGLDESSKECARLILDKARRMQAMIKGLLDYAAAGESPDEKIHSHAGAAVQKALEDLDSMVVANNAEVAAGPLPVVAVAEEQLVQVFSNLISNGIKYCHGGRRPSIQISAAEQNGAHVFSVKDNGIGLDMDYADSIFGVFKRLHGAEYEGSGIGLALCKAVVESHGGRIWVESEVGQGTTFYFTLPAAPSTVRRLAASVS